MTRTQPDWSDLTDSLPHGMAWPALADTRTEAEQHAAMLEAAAERPERCIALAFWGAVAWVLGGALWAVFA
jgi:hypothetical protein